MQKQMKTITAAALLALGLTTLSTPAAAEESLSDRAVSALGHYIAMQGNAALVQIREELTRDLARQIKPYLPSPGPETNAEAVQQKAAQPQ